MTEQILNALTVDVEDYFHVSGFSSTIARSEWDDKESRVDNNTCYLLDIFDEQDVKATFFVLGWVAERYPSIVRKIHARGHEIACHGYSHKLIYRQSKDVFRQETINAKRILEDEIGVNVKGYRAASFSIIDQSLWALDILVEAGFEYDSSIFPIRHDRYGIRTAELWPHRLGTPSGYEIVEFPISTIQVFGFRIPIAGGGYFRLYPYAVTKGGLSIINKSNRPFVFYVHPWEFDVDQPRINASWRARFRHYHNIHRSAERTRRLLGDFKFSTCADVLARQGLLQESG